MFPLNSWKDFEALNTYDGEFEFQMPVKHTDPVLCNEVFDFTLLKAMYRLPSDSFHVKC